MLSCRPGVGIRNGGQMQCISSMCDLHPCISDTANLNLSCLIFVELLILNLDDVVGRSMAASPRSVCFVHIGSSRKDEPLRWSNGWLEEGALPAVVENRELHAEWSSLSIEAALPIIFIWCSARCDVNIDMMFSGWCSTLDGVQNLRGSTKQPFKVFWIKLDLWQLLRNTFRMCTNEYWSYRSHRTVDNYWYFAVMSFINIFLVLQYFYWGGFVRNMMWSRSMPSQGLVLCATGLYVLMESASNEILFFESTCLRRHHYYFSGRYCGVGRTLRWILTTTRSAIGQFP